MKHKTGLVALGVLAAATALMVFFVLPNLEKDKAPEATQDAAQTTAPAAETGSAATTMTDAKGARSDAAAGEAATGEAAATAAGQAAPQAGAGGPASAWQTPSFDVLRVEPDGSTVIAGRAEPNKTLQILNGQTVVATTAVGPSGEFAAVFDKPLAVGDHELTLRILGDGGAAKTSEEVATVSIPKDSSGELLAMVAKPGEASRLITVPDATQDAGQATAAPAAAGASETETETAAVGQPGDAATAANGASQSETGATAGLQPNVRISAVELEGDKMFVAGSSRAGALVRIYANDKLLGEIKADPQGRFVVDGVLPLPVGRHVIRADVMSEDASKVELRASVPFDRPEGEQVAVVAQEPATDGAAPTLGLIDAGSFDKLRAEANKAVALLTGLYANGAVPTAEQLAAARSATEIALQSLSEYKTPAGSAGEAIAARTAAVAAEVLAKLKTLPADAATVGKAIGQIETAVKDALTPATNGQVAEQAPAPTVDVGALENRVLDLSRRFTDLLADAGATPERIAAARVELEGALGQVVGYAAPTGIDAARLALVDKLKLWARSVVEALSSVPADAPKTAYAGALASLKAAPEALLSSTDVAAAGTGQPAAAQSGIATDAAQAVGQEQASAGQPQTIEQAPLKESKNSVIIRRGDTLWQIARRVYGQGVRYTTIYLANEDQIIDPDRILPGQVFGVPDSAMPETEAEEMHRKHVKGN
ncbi:LysM peptidoglycan-binding domain-containing protein [Mycoplana rhizolycopersici]|uniref:LysM peptidoglycan-binding domain-containing protein n=1 Tax=Mycoplana rhizolycopersici TaxID=2746702 RepID=A0ABX2Q9B5_9HYPH|nr:LysM peptidoglycan-binding domain-containing protein [Rhizobium rhizolycopersici]NVP54322.1 LysM peptidoglycan-binding domain-containing protein [Rhizobium rhizolycopersici]